MYRWQATRLVNERKGYHHRQIFAYLLRYRAAIQACVCSSHRGQPSRASYWPDTYKKGHPDIVFGEQLLTRVLTAEASGQTSLAYLDVERKHDSGDAVLTRPAPDWPSINACAWPSPWLHTSRKWHHVRG